VIHAKEEQPMELSDIRHLVTEQTLAFSACQSTGC
jgi:hypothetical protein